MIEFQPKNDTASDQTTVSIIDKNLSVDLDTIELDSIIPLQLRNFVDSRLPNWSFPMYSSYYENWQVFYERVTSPPYFISGNFNDDHLPDYAAILQNDNEIRLYVFITDSNKRFELFEVSNSKLILINQSLVIPVGLSLLQKGEEIFQFDSNDKIILETDAILYNVFETSSSLFFFRNGNFEEALLSD